MCDDDINDDKSCDNYVGFNISECADYGRLSECSDIFESDVDLYHDDGNDKSLTYDDNNNKQQHSSIIIRSNDNNNDNKSNMQSTDSLPIFSLNQQSISFVQKSISNMLRDEKHY